MSLQPGARLGPYEIQSALGAGGMGEVYRATDTKLKRQVAIKILPPSLAADPDRLARFQREAEVLASLNHPHIAAIYGLEDADGVKALVLELVEGPTLADRIAQGVVPVDEALLIAKQIAEALEAAHDQGIIHRDLKPANIKVRPDGTVKVLDFGLAKAMEPVGSAPNVSQSPTITTPAMTQAGMILGTAAYMAPEQAKGGAADARSDIWAFGLILYEMLTGTSGFGGETMLEVLSNVLKADPDWTALPPATPPGIRSLLRRCLQKDRTRRLRDIADARFQIEDALSEPATTAAAGAAVPVKNTRERLLWIAALVAAVAATAVLVASLRQSVEADEVRLEINTPPARDTSLAVSPDGRKIVFQAATQDGTRLWLRSLDSMAARPLAGTDGGTSPFWSPDGRSIGFFADASSLKHIDIESGVVQVVTIASGAAGGSWNRDGTILIGGNLDPILRVPATGGKAVPVTSPQQPGLKVFPQFLPDGKHFLYYVTLAPEAGVYVGQIDSVETRRLLVADSPAVYTASGQLLFERQGTLFAQAFDPSGLTLAGNPYAVSDRVLGNFGNVLASSGGTIAYRAGSQADSQQQFLWFDRSGKQVGSVGDPGPFGLPNPSLSPDGRRLAIMRGGENTDVWLLDVGRNVLSRFTSDPSFDNDPLWSPDGTRIVFSSNRKGTFDLYQKSVQGAQTEDVVVASTQLKVATDWSADGRHLLYQSRDPNTNTDLWALPLSGDNRPIPVAQTNAAELNGQFSSDGRWVAYQSDESGRFEVYLQPFPGPGVKSQASMSGGVQPRWRRDGKELFYLTLDGRLMAVPIQFSSAGQAADAGTAVPLFLTHVSNIQGVNVRHHYVVSPDGQRFLIDTLQQPPSPITVILNWKPKP